eukprot:scaffold6925_cov180-Amphora_coffeaeformis.AAC.2
MTGDGWMALEWTRLHVGMAQEKNVAEEEQKVRHCGGKRSRLGDRIQPRSGLGGSEGWTGNVRSEVFRPWGVSRAEFSYGNGVWHHGLVP